MRFSETAQPRFAVYVVRESDRRHVLVARYGSLMRAIIARDTALENGEAAYLDVNH